jgi:hypothetical protein
MPDVEGEGINPGQMTARMIVGGIASKLGGGSFANGALSAAMEYLYNQQGGSGVVQVEASLTSRATAFTEIIKEFGLERSTMKSTVERYTEHTRPIQVETKAGTQPAMSRVYDAVGKDGARFRITDHQYGHLFRDKVGPQSPHFNVHKLVDGKWQEVGTPHYSYRPPYGTLTTRIRYSDGSLRPQIQWRIAGGDKN